MRAGTDISFRYFRGKAQGKDHEIDPKLVCFSQRAFTNESIEAFAAKSLAAPATLVSDGLGCFTAVVGMLFGPFGFNFLPSTESGRHVAEFGIVFLMFSVGLEFSLPKLYAMRKTLFGLGGAQVLITLGVSMLVGWLVGLSLPTAFVIGGALTMSSTAIVSKILMERVDLNSRHGRLSIGILLFQDLAVIPILVLIPALGAHSGDLRTVLTLSLLKTIVLLFVLLKFGKVVINYWFELVAGQRSRELFVMNVLMVTLLLASATKLAGLSYALGAFIAGMLISETRYRYQVESDIAPFRDILLGLFFISVGMLLNFNYLLNHIGLVLALLAGFVLFKAVVVALLTRIIGYEMGVGIRTGIILAQAGRVQFCVAGTWARAKTHWRRRATSSAGGIINFDDYRAVYYSKKWPHCAQTGQKLHQK